MMSTADFRARKVRSAVAAIAAVAVGATAAACGGSSSKSGGGGGTGTVTIGISSDPGNLSPTTALASTATMINGYAYDRLVHVAPDGTITAGVAEKWTATATTAQFTIRPGVTCQDGSPLTATEVAAEYNYIADPKNQSPMLGLGVPVTAVAKADTAARTVSITTTAPAPFIVEMAFVLPLVCAKNLPDPTALAKTTNASGPYQLTEAVPGDHYTYTKRAGYTWGPDGSTNAAMPATVVFKVVTNTSTAANMLLSGQLNLAQINGPDVQRLDGAKVPRKAVQVPFGQIMFNEAAARPTADPAVRKALVEALDLKQIGTVATGGTGKPATGIGEVAPSPCTGDTVAGNVPAHDAAQAAADLTAAGWTKIGGAWTKDGKPLTVTQVYSTLGGPDMAAAIELAAQQLTAFGVKVTGAPTDSSTVASTLAAGAWDLAWIPISVVFPDQLTRFYDGAAPPNGSNFASIANPDYQSFSKQAMAVAGKAGCPLWEKADSALVKRVDVVPVVSNMLGYYGKGVTYQLDAAGVVPSSLRAGS